MRKCAREGSDNLFLELESSSQELVCDLGIGEVEELGQGGGGGGGGGFGFRQQLRHLVWEVAIGHVLSGTIYARKGCCWWWWWWWIFEQALWVLAG